MISFAQNAEDVLIHRFFEGEAPQTYVDVGAADPVYHSVTKHFYDLGWCGINIEPRRRLFNALCAQRPRDTTIQCCVSSEAGELPFYEVEVGAADSNSDNGGLSTVDGQLAFDYRSRGFAVSESRRDVRTLSEIFASQGQKEIGFLKIDVEGHEPQVVSGLDWQRWRPRLVILESTIPLSSELADQAPTRLLESHGYKMAFFDGLNQFLVRDEDNHKLPLLQTPANVFDDFVPHAHIVQLADRDAEIQRQKETIARLNQKLQNQLPAWMQLFTGRRAA